MDTKQDATIRTPILSWYKGSLEDRFRFASGKNTDVNFLFSGMIGFLLTGVFYGGLIAIERGLGSNFVVEKFLDRGVVPPIVCFLFFSCLATLWVKRKKIELQRTPLLVAVLPQKSDFALTRGNVQTYIDRMESIADAPTRFILLNRIQIALTTFRNLGMATEAIQALDNQADSDEAQIEGSYNVVAGIIWAIPVMGFVGTVLGLAGAMDGFGSTLAMSDDLGAVRDALTTVVGGLSTAFDTTLLGLIGAVVLQLHSTFTKKREYQMLDECGTYCREHLIGRFTVR